MPVAGGHLTSSFGMRMHLDPRLARACTRASTSARPMGAPIHAAMDGARRSLPAAQARALWQFRQAPPSGGSIATGYAHMSRIIARPGEHVRQGQLIGAVGSTGLSTGPHLHWEVWKNGVSVNPRSMSFSSVAQLSGEALRAFKAKVSYLLAVGKSPARRG